MSIEFAAEFIPQSELEENQPEVKEAPAENQTENPSGSDFPEWLKDPLYESLKEEYGEIPAYLKRFKSPVEAVKAAYEAKRTLSRKLVDLPDDQSPDEVWDEVYSRLGRIDPENTKLEIEIDGELVDVGDSINPNFKEVILKAAHAMGANQRGLRKALQTIFEFEQKLPEKHKEFLSSEWKGDYKKNLSLVNKMFQTIPESLRNEIITGYGPLNPTISKLLLHFAKRTGNDSSIPSREVIPQTIQNTLEEVTAQIDKIYADKNNPLNPAHPEHGEKEMEALTALFVKQAELQARLQNIR